MIVTRLTPTPKGDKNSLIEAVKTQKNSEFTVINLTKIFTKIDVSIIYWTFWYVVTITGYYTPKELKIFTEILKTKTEVISRLTTLLKQYGFKDEIPRQKKFDIALNILQEKFSLTSSTNSTKVMTLPELYKLINKIWNDNWYLSFSSKDILKNFTTEYDLLKEWELVSISVSKDKKELSFEYVNWNKKTISNIFMPINSIFYFKQKQEIKLEVLSKNYIKWKRTNQENLTEYTIETNTCNQSQIKSKLEELSIYSPTEVWCTRSFILVDVIDSKYKYLITKTNLPTD